MPGIIYDNQFYYRRIISAFIATKIFQFFITAKGHTPKQSRRHGGALVGSAPKRTSKPPKLKYETLLICGVFVDFKNVKPPPIEVFLATVLLPSEALFPTHTHRHIINKQLETKVRVV